MQLENTIVHISIKKLCENFTLERLFDPNHCFVNYIATDPKMLPSLYLHGVIWLTINTPLALGEKRKVLAVEDLIRFKGTFSRCSYICTWNTCLKE